MDNPAKKSNCRFCWWIAPIFCLFQACAGGGPVTSVEPANTDTLQYRLLEVVRTSPGCATADSSDCTRAAAQYLEFTGGGAEPVLKQLNQTLVDSLCQGYTSIEKMLEQFVEDYENAKSEETTGMPWEGAWFQYVVSQYAHVVCVGDNQYSFTGGAHGNYATTFRNYDRRSGQIIKAGDLLTGGLSPELTAMAEPLSRNTYQIPDSSTYDAAGYWLENEQFYLTENFAVTAEGLLFLYNPYEIAPYAMGPQELLLPYTLMAHLIKPEGPLTVK